MKQVNKALYDEHINKVHSETMYFWEKGFVEISDFTDPNPKISLTTKAFDSNAVATLPVEKAELLTKLKEALGFYK
jgi:hypothetical protein